jgi:energy-coupling factor transporter ATP-binding protein EcfA2
MSKTRRKKRFNPFPGLRPFGADEDYLFFGREQEIAQLLTLLRENRFLGVVGTSGSGKSSLVRAGLLPELLGGGMSGTGSAWEALTMRPAGAPLLNLAKAFCEAGLYDAEEPDALPQLQATLNRSRSGLVEAARQSDLESDTQLVVLVDQFEEIFRMEERGASGLDEARAFVRLLIEASEQQEVPIYIVLTMRSDYIGDCAKFTGLAEAINRGEYLIPKFSRDQLQAAIEGPVKVGGGAIAFRLVQRLLNDVGDAQDQLPVLQHALMRTWDRWEADTADRADPANGDDSPLAMDLEHYEAVGTLQEALSLHADEIFDTLSDEAHRRTARRLFEALTEKGEDNRGIRRPMRLHRLLAIAGSSQETVTQVIDAYRAPGVTFLMPGEEHELNPQTVIDISHESLMRVWRRLRRWVEEEAQSARIYRRLVDTAGLWKDGKAGLYHDPDLQIAQSWREEAQPNAAWAELYGSGFDTAMGFLEKSHQVAEAEEVEREGGRPPARAGAGQGPGGGAAAARRGTTVARRTPETLRQAPALAGGGKPGDGAGCLFRLPRGAARGEARGSGKNRSRSLA